MPDSKFTSMLNIKREQSNIIVDVEELRQLILTSSLSNGSKMYFDTMLSALNKDIDNHYEALMQAPKEVGNI